VITNLEVNLRADLSLLGMESVGTGGLPLRLMGGTHDLSARGLSLVLPSVRVDERFPASINPTVNVTVRTPGGSVEMKATVVYVLAPDERSSSPASIVGLRIDETNERPQRLLMTYLNEIS
jgi:hypothetical protein